MINYKKPGALIILLFLLIASNETFCKKKDANAFVKIEKKFHDCNFIIVDTLIKKQRFKTCYDSLKNKVEVNYNGLAIDFTPMEFFNAKWTIDKEYFLLTKKESQYSKSKIIVIDDHKILFSLIDEFLASGLYLISEIDGKLVIENINLNNRNISATELAYFDLSGKNLILADKLSQDGKKCAVNVYDLSGNKPKLIKQRIINWSKYKNQIKKSKDGYYDAASYYVIMDKLIKN